MKKQGHPDDRRIAAEHLREVRAMYPHLKGVWSRREWYQKCLQGTHNLLSNLTMFRRANHG